MIMFLLNLLTSLDTNILRIRDNMLKILFYLLTLYIWHQPYLRLLILQFQYKILYVNNYKKIFPNILL